MTADRKAKMTLKAVQPMVSYFVWRVFDHANAHDLREE
jgi:hypothetical protein